MAHETISDCSGQLGDSSLGTSLTLHRRFRCGAVLSLSYSRDNFNHRPGQPLNAKCSMVGRQANSRPGLERTKWMFYRGWRKRGSGLCELRSLRPRERIVQRAQYAAHHQARPQRVDCGARPNCHRRSHRATPSWGRTDSRVASTPSACIGVTNQHESQHWRVQPLRQGMVHKCGPKLEQEMSATQGR